MLMAIDWKKYVNTHSVLGAGAGYYLGSTKLKKHGVYGAAGGALGGAVAGLLVKHVLTPSGAPAQAVGPNPGGPQPQVAQAPGQGEYVNLGFGEYAPQNPTQRAEHAAYQAAEDNNGSLSGGNGLGSLSGVPGFDGETIDYDEILGEDGGGDGFN